MQHPTTGRYLLDAEPIAPRRKVLSPTPQSSAAPSATIPWLILLWTGVGLLTAGWLALEHWQLKQKEERLVLQLDRVSSAREALLHQLTKKQTETQALWKDREILAGQLDTAGKNQKQLTADLQSAKEAKDSAETRHQSLITEWKNYGNTVEQTLGQTRAQLSNTWGQLHQAVNAVNSKTQETHVLKQSVQEHSAQRDVLSQHLSAARSQADSLQCEVRRLEGTQSSLTSEVSCLKATVCRLESDKSLLQSEICSLKATVCRLESELKAATR
jgi:chromosome segregation ATPase